MMSISTGWQTGLAAARRVYEDPSQAYSRRTFLDQAAAYSLLWAYYNNSLFDRAAANLQVWTAYKSAYALYRNIRLIYNPTRRLVDFYAGQVYPGVLADSASSSPPTAIPLSPDTPADLSSAITQFWQWSNWQARKAVEVRYGAALGSVLVEVVDDLEHGKVRAEIVWPGFVTDLMLDGAGNVKAYATQYLATDEEGTYIYRKEVDGDYFRYYRNNQPHDYGAGAVAANPYGFVPAVWIKHSDTGSDTGSPAVAGSLGKIDELNNLASHVHDQIHKVIGAPIVLWSSGSVQNIWNTQKRGATSDFPEPAQDQESLLMLKGSADGRVDSLAGNLSLADAAVHMDRLLGEIEQDHPELVFYKELRSMSQVTGPAASRLVGDVTSRVTEAAANYDRANIALFQMAVAIGGMRANSSAWGNLNRQQQKFLPFNLSSYERGDLDFSIEPRPLLVPTKLETSQEKQAMWTGVGLGVKAGVPLEFVLQDEGFSDEELAKLAEAKVKEPPPAPQPPQLQTQQVPLMLAGGSQNGQ